MMLRLSPAASASSTIVVLLLVAGQSSAFSNNWVSSSNKNNKNVVVVAAAAISSSSGSSQIGIDENGLRGLQWKDAAKNDGIVCRIPRRCAIVPSTNKGGAHQRPIDALAYTVLCHLRNNDDKDDPEYFKSGIPQASDLSLATIGGAWTEEQCERLGHAPTQQQFRAMRKLRTDFITQNSKDNDVVLAGWAYDLATTRGLEGSFGKGGAVRASTVALLASAGVALWPFVTLLLLQSGDASSSAIPVISLLPLILTSVVTTVVMVSSNEQPELAMLPYVDLANHKSKHRGMAFEYDFMNDSIVFKKKNGSNSDDDEWIVFDYGGPEGICNDRLLGEYGFVEHDNPSDTFQLATTTTSAAKPIATIGRNGVILNHPDDSDTTTTIQQIVDAATAARLSLAATPSSSSPSIDLEDPIDVERAALATTWRKEKVRLLDEFLEKHHQI